MTSNILFACLLVVLTAISVVDLRERRIPDGLNLTLALLGIVFKVHSMEPTAAIQFAVIGGLTYGLIFFALRAAFLHVRHVEALGLGDVKFAAAAGIWLGVDQLPTFMLLAPTLTLLGILAVSFIRKRTTRLRISVQIPFGPGLSVAMAILVAKQMIQSFAGG